MGLTTAPICVYGDKFNCQIDIPGIGNNTDLWAMNVSFHMLEKDQEWGRRAVQTVDSIFTT
ncbi:hypothetical protein JCM10550A_03750 [Methanogenium cariaci]